MLCPDLEADGNYIKTLLDENLQLKDKLAKMSKSGKSVKIVENPGMKENLENIPQEAGAGRSNAPGTRLPFVGANSNPPVRAQTFAPRAQPSQQRFPGRNPPNLPRQPQFRARNPPNIGPRFPANQRLPRGPAPNQRPPGGNPANQRPPGGGTAPHPPPAKTGCVNGDPNGVSRNQEVQHLAEHNKCLLNQVIVT